MSDETGASSEQAEAGQDYTDLKTSLDHLADAIDREPSNDEARWLRGIQAAAHSLFDSLQHHEDVTEEEGGILPEMTGQKPGLMAERERLEREHTEMLHRAEEVEEEVDRQFSFDEFNTELIRLEASILRDILRLHLLRTDASMYEAYFQIEGGESG